MDDHPRLGHRRLRRVERGHDLGSAGEHQAPGKLVKAKPLTWLHQSLDIAALVATAVHIGVLSIHDYLDFTRGEILVPGVSDWTGPMVPIRRACLLWTAELAPDLLEA